jgi:Icc-related predicted phosphoesterase
MVSFGYVNPTPWKTPREMSEEEIMKWLNRVTSKLSSSERAIFNFHAPPYGTNLDLAPKLTQDLRPVVRGGQIETIHVGSKSVRSIIVEMKPMLGLHGHIHESKSFDRLGGTLVLNPGSEYGIGLLHAALVVLERGRVKAYQFIVG